MGLYTYNPISVLQKSFLHQGRFLTALVKSQTVQPITMRYLCPSHHGLFTLNDQKLEPVYVLQHTVLTTYNTLIASIVVNYIYRPN